MCIAGGKHSLYCSIDNTVQLNLADMSSVVVDEKAQTATIRGGAKLRMLDAACAPLGLATTVGTNPDTGVIGLTLGGGQGYLMRAKGLAMDNLLSARMVLADASVVVVNASPTEQSDRRSIRGEIEI
jgi:FAD/FMN-containing dehydrogenase